MSKDISKILHISFKYPSTYPSTYPSHSEYPSTYPSTYPSHSNDPSINPSQNPSTILQISFTFEGSFMRSFTISFNDPSNILQMSSNRSVAFEISFNRPFKLSFKYPSPILQRSFNYPSNYHQCKTANVTNVKPQRVPV